MNKTILFAILFLIILSAAASAQVLVSVEEKTTCGDGIREGHEMCEPDTDQDLCEAAGKIIGIVMVCDERDCTCLPKRMDCGNEIQEGAEFCDPGEKEAPEENDFCPQLGREVFNETFTCDPDSCQCVPERYYGVPPPAVCGDGNVTRDEECEIDKDCRADQKCVNCTCVIKERNETVIKEIKEELTKKETRTEEKEEKKEFSHKGLVGEILPDYLDDFEEERANVYIELKNGSAQVVGVVTQYGVVQQITDGKIDGATYDFFVKEEKAKQIIASEDRIKALGDAIEAGEVTYKPRGLFARMWYWFVGLFK